MTDPDGAPVEGLEARLHVFLPPGVIRFADKAVAGINFSVPEISMVNLTVYDMDGNVVRTLVQGTMPAGFHEVRLANDDEGNPLMGTHLYRCEMVANVDSVEKFRKETFLTLYTGYDMDQHPVLGVTDDEGKISFGKRTEFPYLYNPGPQTAIDEDGRPMGTFEFIDKVEITLMDSVLNLSSNYEVSIGQGHNAVKLVWDPTLKSKSHELVDRAAEGVGVIGSGPVSVPDDKDVLVYSLGPGYPNPFN